MPKKKFISPICNALALTALLATPGIAHADQCSDIDTSDKELEKKLMRLTLDHPVIMSSVVGCVEAAKSKNGQDRDITLGLCMATICIFAGQDSCGEVAMRILSLVFEKAAIEARRETLHCPKKTSTLDLGVFDEGRAPKVTIRVPATT